MNKRDINRRDFIKKSALAGAAIGLAGTYSVSGSAKSANDRVVVAVMGGRARSAALAPAFAGVSSTEVKSVFDVDHRPLPKLAQNLEEIQGRKPEYGTDFRRALDDRDIDALVIGVPDHWHTPATIMALQAGKHVYVEKPASHNPAETELIVQAQKRYNRLVQMGNQHRSGRLTMQTVQQIRDGIIGEPYYAKAFYANARGPIGTGRIAPVPDWLDYELWQ